MNDTARYQKKLDEEKALLIKELGEIGIVKDKRNPDDWEAIPTDTSDNRSDSNDVADRIESYENNTALVRELESRLAEIDRASARIKEGKYGRCEVCNRPIEEDRLDANPAATTCKEHMNS